MLISLLRRIFNRFEGKTPTHWLIVAGVFHAAVTIAVYLIGHFRLLPNAFDENGSGISFALDSTAYRLVIIEMISVVQSQGLSALLHTGPFHCRLYTLVFLFPGNLIGYNILAAEVLNVIYYLVILTLIYLLGKVIFDSQTGLVAAIVVAVWPTFLLHSTQILRDSLSTALMLGLVLILVLIIRRDLSWRNSLAISVGGVFLVIAFWLARGNLWNIVDFALATCTVLLVVRMICERRLLGANVIVLTVIFAAALLVPARIESTTLPGIKPPTALIAIPSGPPASSRSLWSQLITQIQSRRSGFKVYNAQGSNIDSDVVFHSASDIIKYVPRAVVVGLFAPFPKMWFEVGTGGRTGRLISGAETLIMYLLYIAAAYSIWINRRNLAVWLIFLVAFIGMTALGLVVVNAGALYRVRYVFWIFVILLSVEGVRLLLRKWRPITDTAVLPR